MGASLRMMGAIVDMATAAAFAEKCKPHETSEVIEALIKAVANGDIKLNWEKKK